ncbi:hypothetical protein K443DRAFT_107561, partial [Laccaria amethystina LaAM-08-1]
QAHSAMPTYHWGVSKGISSTPLITHESQIQSFEAVAAIDCLLSLVGQLVAPKVIQMT